MTIYKSRFDDVPLSPMSVTQRVFAGIDAGATVLIDGVTGEELSGAQFMSAVKSLAGGLSAQGYGGARVALMAPNCPDYAVVFHGVLWAGGSVTPLNPTYTAQEVRHQLLDAGADLLVTAPMFLDTARAAIKDTQVREIVVLGEKPPQGGDERALSDLMGTEQPEQSPIDLDSHVACLPYSSGTTGLPKGVMLSHRNLSTNIDQSIAVVQPIRGSRAVAFLPFFHIYGLQSLLNSGLSAGVCVITMPRFDLERYLTLVETHRTPRLWIVPPVALALAKHPMVAQFDLSHVQQISSAAAPLGADIANAIGERLGTFAAQGFGMTELSPVSHASPPGQGRRGASGLTLPNTECRVVDPETGQDCPQGTNGELWVRGPQVMLGYLNNPTATAATITREGWLRTGDIAHFDTDGYLYITDRLKELIKVKGFQVAPAELEALILTHPDITDAAVIGWKDNDAGEVPMAFVVGENAPDLATLQDFLAPQIAHYKQIQRLEPVSEIPKSAAGKILRRVLRDTWSAG